MMKKNIVSSISVVLSIRLVMLKSKLLQQYNACPLNLRTFSYIKYIHNLQCYSYVSYIIYINKLSGVFVFLVCSINCKLGKMFVSDRYFCERQIN